LQRPRTRAYLAISSGLAGCNATASAAAEPEEQSPGEAGLEASRELSEPEARGSERRKGGGEEAGAGGFI